MQIFLTWWRVWILRSCGNPMISFHPLLFWGKILHHLGVSKGSLESSWGAIDLKWQAEVAAKNQSLEAMQKELSKARSCFTWEITWEISFVYLEHGLSIKGNLRIERIFFLGFYIKPPFRWMNLEVLKPPLMAITAADCPEAPMTTDQWIHTDRRWKKFVNFQEKQVPKFEQNLLKIRLGKNNDI